MPLPELDPTDPLQQALGPGEATGAGAFQSPTGAAGGLPPLADIIKAQSAPQNGLKRVGTSLFAGLRDLGAINRGVKSPQHVQQLQRQRSVEKSRQLQQLIQLKNIEIQEKRFRETSAREDAKFDLLVSKELRDITEKGIDDPASAKSALMRFTKEGKDGRKPVLTVEAVERRVGEIEAASQRKKMAAYISISKSTGEPVFKVMNAHQDASPSELTRRAREFQTRKLVSDQQDKLQRERIAARKKAADLEFRRKIIQHDPEKALIRANGSIIREAVTKDEKESPTALIKNAAFYSKLLGISLKEGAILAGGLRDEKLDAVAGGVVSTSQVPGEPRVQRLPATGPKPNIPKLPFNLEKGIQPPSVQREAQSVEEIQSPMPKSPRLKGEIMTATDAIGVHALGLAGFLTERVRNAWLAQVNPKLGSADVAFRREVLKQFKQGIQNVFRSSDRVLKEEFGTVKDFSPALGPASSIVDAQAKLKALHQNLLLRAKAANAIIGDPNESPKNIREAKGLKRKIIRLFEMMGDVSKMPDLSGGQTGLGALRGAIKGAAGAGKEIKDLQGNPTGVIVDTNDDVDKDGVKFHSSEVIK